MKDYKNFVSVIRLFFLAFWMLLGKYSSAQLGLPSSLVYKNFGTVNGYLSNARVFNTMIDPYGYLWVGTEDGLFRYNGKSFETISLNTNAQIYYLDIVQKDLLLVLFHNGKTIGVDIKTRMLINTDSLYGLDKVLQNGRSYAIFFNRGDTSLLLKKSYSDSVSNTLSMVKLFAHKAVLPKSRNESMQWACRFIFNTDYSAEAEKVIDHWVKNISFLNKKKNIQVFNNSVYFQSNKDSSYKLIFDANSQGPGNIISCALLHDKQLFVGLLNGGLIHYFNYLDSGMKSSSEKIFKDEMITDIIEDENKNIWVSSLGNGLFMIRNQDLQTRYYNQKNSGLSNDEVMMLQKLDEYNTVSYSFTNSILETYGATIHKKDSFDFWVQQIFAFGNSAYICYNNGIKKSSYAPFSGIGQMKNFITLDNQAFAWNEVSKWGNKYYCLGVSSIYIFDSLGNYTIKSILPIKNAMRLCPLSDSDFLIGTTEGIYHNSEKLEWLQDGDFNKIMQSGNELILCTRQGIFGININEINNPKALYKINPEPAYNVYIDNDYLYFQTKLGILVLDKQSKKLVKEKSTLSYAIPFSISDFFVDDTYVALAGNKGIFYVPKKDFLLKSKAPKIYILNSLNNNKPADSLYECSYQKKLVAFFDLNILGDESGSAKIQYRILKDGVDYNDWTMVKESPLITLNRPEPGDYLIQYKVSADNGDWTQLVSYKLSILPLWWQTIWFKLLALIFVLTIVYLLMNIIVKYQHKKKLHALSDQLYIKELEANALSAQLNPHFIFNALTPFQDFTIKGESKSALEYVNIFATLIRGILNNSRKRFISLDEELEFIKFYLEVQQKRYNNKFDYSIKLAEAIDGKHIQIPTLLLQPIVENAIEHGVRGLAYRGQIDINIDIEGETLIFIISDNGKGVPDLSNYLKSNHALEIIYERIQLIKKTHKIGFMSIENDSGLTVKIYLPLKLSSK